MICIDHINLLKIYTFIFSRKKCLKGHIGGLRSPDKARGAVFVGVAAVVRRLRESSYRSCHVEAPPHRGGSHPGTTRAQKRWRSDYKIISHHFYSLYSLYSISHLSDALYFRISWHLRKTCRSSVLYSCYFNMIETSP